MALEDYMIEILMFMMGNSFLDNYMDIQDRFGILVVIKNLKVKMIYGLNN